MDAILNDPSSWPQAIWVAMLIFLRIGAAAALLPAFGEQTLPIRVRLAAALALSLVLAPLLWAEVQQAIPETPPAQLIAAEVVAGLLLGAAFRLFVIALQVAGSVAAQSTSLSQIFGAGVGAEPQPAFSTLFVLGGLCLATMAGLHVQVIRALLLSYEAFPLGVLPSGSAVAAWGTARVGHAFNLGVTLAGPFVLASLLYNLGLGAINKAMPQLMVAFVGAPAISFGGLVLLLLSTPFLLEIWLDSFLSSTGQELWGLP